MSDFIFFDELEGFFGIEAVHDESGSAAAHDSHCKSERRGVIERRRREVDRFSGRLIEQDKQSDDAVWRIEGLFGERMAHTFRPPGGSGGVEHISASRGVGDEVGGLLLSSVEVVLEAADFVAVAEGEDVGGDDIFDFACGVSEFVGDEEHFSVAVIDDVIGFGRGESSGHGGKVDAGALSAPANFEESGCIFHKECDSVAVFESGAAEQVSDLVSALFELGVRDALAGLSHDEGGLIGFGFGVMMRMRGRIDGFEGLGVWGYLAHNFLLLFFGIIDILRGKGKRVGVV